MSKQTELIVRTDEGATDGKITTATSIQPYQTYWEGTSSFMQTAFQDDRYNLLFPNGTSTSYWMASRSVSVGPEGCGFRVSHVFKGSINANYVFWSRDASNDGYPRELFPIVSLNANLISGNDTAGWSVEI